MCFGWDHGTSLGLTDVDFWRVDSALFVRAMISNICYNVKVYDKFHLCFSKKQVYSFRFDCYWKLYIRHILRQLVAKRSTLTSNVASQSLESWYFLQARHRLRPFNTDVLFDMFQQVDFIAMNATWLHTQSWVVLFHYVLRSELREQSSQLPIFNSKLYKNTLRYLDVHHCRSETHSICGSRCDIGLKAQTPSIQSLEVRQSHYLIIAEQACTCPSISHRPCVPWSRTLSDDPRIRLLWRAGGGLHRCIPGRDWWLGPGSSCKTWQLTVVVCPCWQLPCASHFCICRSSRAVISKKQVPRQWFYTPRYAHNVSRMLGEKYSVAEWTLVRSGGRFTWSMSPRLTTRASFTGSTVNHSPLFRTCKPATSFCIKIVIAPLSECACQPANRSSSRSPGGFFV